MWQRRKKNGDPGQGAGSATVAGTETFFFQPLKNIPGKKEHLPRLPRGKANVGVLTTEGRRDRQPAAPVRPGAGDKCPTLSARMRPLSASRSLYQRSQRSK